MDENSKVFWHEAFYEAIQLEFHQYKDALIFDNEFQLSKEALIMDVLVIKKKPGQCINKNIGRIFQTHNIFEYKSETDSLTPHDYTKVVAYALLYSSFNKVTVSDITVTFALTMHPRTLIKYLENERGLTVQISETGIYYIEGDTFPIQILESKRLAPDENLFLHNLRSNLSFEDIAKTIKAYESIKYFEPKNAYMDRLIKANKNMFKEASHMSEAAMEILMEVSKERPEWFAEVSGIYQKKKIAQKMLLRGDTIEDVVEITELPYETVANLV